MANDTCILFNRNNKNNYDKRVKLYSDFSYRLHCDDGAALTSEVNFH